MAGKISLGGSPYGVLREPLKKELIEMLLKKPAVIIENEQETDLDLCEQEEMRPSLPPEPKLGYLINVLKKPGISLEQVGEKAGLSFWRISFVSSNCSISGRVTTFVFYTTIFIRSHLSIGRGKMQYLKSSRKICRRWNKPERKPKKVSTNGGWL